MFLGLLRRRLRDTTAAWSPHDERAYRDLRTELSPAIGAHVIDQNNWWTLIRVAFDLAEERFPLIYRDDAYDDFRPGKDTVAGLHSTSRRRASLVSLIVTSAISTRAFCRADVVASPVGARGAVSRPSSARSTRHGLMSTTW